MKNILIALVTAGVTAWAGTNGANAQSQVSSERSSFGKSVIANKETITPDALAELESINPRALRNFAEAYKNAEGVSWTKTKNGYFARFTSNGVDNRIFYTVKGRWTGSVKNYSEEKLPGEVRNIVKSKYYDYSIFYVDELETLDSGGMPTYLIHLEDKKTIKLVRVCDREMEVWKEYRKSKG